MSVKGVEVVKAMMKMGDMVTINQIIDQETAQLVAEEMGFKVVLVKENELEKPISPHDIPGDWLCPDCGMGKDDFDMEEI